MIEKFLTTEQVANILQIHTLTVLRFLKSGKLKGIKLGRVYRIKESEVKEFLEERTIDNSPKRKKTATEELPKPKMEEDSEDNKEHYYII